MSKKLDTIADAIWILAMVAVCFFAVSVLTGCAGSLGANPREWTEAKAKDCLWKGGMPVYNQNTERTMCSTDIVW